MNSVINSEYVAFIPIGQPVVAQLETTLIEAGIMPQPVAQLQKTENDVFAEYALRDISKPIGVSDYELTRALPDNLKSSLPSIEEIEAELSEGMEDE
jgi:hypothetical protein